MKETHSLQQDVSLPPGFRWRCAVPEDLHAVTELIQMVDLEDLGEADLSEEELQTEWDKAGFDLQQDAWVVESHADEHGRSSIIGYEELWNRKGHALLEGDGYVHPQYRGLGIGTALLQLQEVRARQHLLLASPELRVSVRNAMEINDKAGRQLHENNGFQPVRFFYRMQIELDQEPQPPSWPEGIQLSTYQPGQERLYFEALQESFRDHWGFTPWNYDSWLKRNINRSGFEPDLFLIAWSGGEIAGASLCRRRQEDGWVGQLGVRRPWRKQGLGMALLQQSFFEFYRRGIPRIALGVDASNETGATRLYERAGMQPIHQFVLMEKELRDGIHPQEEEE
jgi:mycothiol synthase